MIISYNMTFFLGFRKLQSKPEPKPDYLLKYSNVTKIAFLSILFDYVGLLCGYIVYSTSMQKEEKMVSYFQSDLIISSFVMLYRWAGTE